MCSCYHFHFNMVFNNRFDLNKTSSLFTCYHIKIDKEAAGAAIPGSLHQCIQLGTDRFL